MHLIIRIMKFVVTTGGNRIYSLGKQHSFVLIIADFGHCMHVNLN